MTEQRFKDAVCTIKGMIEFFEIRQESMEPKEVNQIAFKNQKQTSKKKKNKNKKYKKN